MSRNAAVKAMYHTIGDEYFGKPPRGHKTWMSKITWTHIQERADIRANINTASSVERLTELRVLYNNNNNNFGTNTRNWARPRTYSKL